MAKKLQRPPFSPFLKSKFEVSLISHACIFLHKTMLLNVFPRFPECLTRQKKTNAVYGSSAAYNHRVLPAIHHYYLPKLRGYAASEIDFLLLFNPLPGPLSSSLLTSYHMYIYSSMHRAFFLVIPALSKGPSPSENKFQIRKS